MKYYVDQKTQTAGDGSKEYPFRRIQEAADAAVPGDKIIVMPGIYRENVNPKRGGTRKKRIEYISFEKGKAVITGSEPVKVWEKAKSCENTWVARIPNGLFGNYNPFTTLVTGDWFIQTIVAHTGDVFLNGKSMYEVLNVDEVENPVVKENSWDKDFSVYVWYTRQDEKSNETVIYANFQGKDPHTEDVEISVRENCFWPQEEGRGYITFSGFTVKNAATKWAPPTAFQEGMIGPHWSKGWIIEDCDISDSKCCGISLGKYKLKGNDNKWSLWKYKDGTQTERECICQAQAEGWSKDTIGSHIIRRCSIHDCGQTGIVGHLGGVFSLIEDNHIYNINNKQNLAGAEIGGIKMHAAIDVVIRRNRIHHCTRGIWLDWQAQGTRVSQNMFYDNTLPYVGDKLDVAAFSALGEDVFIEVSHGPTLLDNNFFLSDRAVKIACQGVALVHNVVAGGLVAIGIGTDNGGINLPTQRYTPYHMHHATEVAGFMTFLHGDDRFYNNIFIQKPVRDGMKVMMDLMSNDGNTWDDCNLLAGTFPFDGYPTESEWKKEFEGYCGMGSPGSDRYYMHLPVWTGGNVFLNGARAWEKEENYLADDADKVTISVKDSGDEFELETNLFDVVKKLIKDRSFNTAMISTETLGMAFEPEQKFENPDGSPVIFNSDYYGNNRAVNPTPGPMELEF